MTTTSTLAWPPSCVALALLLAASASGGCASMSSRVPHEPVRMPTLADQDEPPPPETEYQNAIRPYFWMAGVDGDVKVRGISADIDESFGDILDQLDMGLMVGYEHAFEGWSLLLDSFYVKLTEDAHIGPLEVDNELVTAFLEVAGAVPVYECEEDGGVVDGIVGARAWYVSNDLEIAGFSRDGSSDWVDPIVGARWLMPLGERWQLRLRGDVGGFGIGSASHLTWQGVVTLGYAISERTHLGFGYRYLDVDREKGSGGDEEELDLAFNGVLVGLDYRF